MEKQKQKTGLCKMISAWIICIVLVMSVPIQAELLMTPVGGSMKVSLLLGEISQLLLAIDIV